jgi:trans-aconitate 2-methyltransferase
MQWNPESYARYGGIRLRPAVDLINAVPPLPAGDVVDLGCGNGAVGPPLRVFERRLVGVDSSPEMLADARRTEAHDVLVQTDVSAWTPAAPPALIFSNAALHWIGEHRSLLPRLASAVAPGGTLAVQMPHQNRAPSHRLWVSLAEEFFPGRIDPESGPGVLEPADYHHLLAPLGRLHLWETEYYQSLPPAETGHPVRRFTEATFARPILDALTGLERARLIAEYEAVIGKAYPAAEDGTVLFPFRRLFFTLTKLPE